MSLSIVLDRSARAPIYQQIAGQIREQISAGNLPCGARLPTIRQLAQQLGVTRLTVQTAYAELQSGGWLEATVGRGTFVSQVTADNELGTTTASGPARAVTPATVMGDILQIGHGREKHSLASASPDPQLFPADEFWACLADQRKNAASAHRMTGESEDDAATPVFPPLNAVTFPENLIQLPLRNIGVANNGQCRSIDSGTPFGCAQTENPGSPPEGSGLATESTNIHGLLQTENHG